MFKNMAAAITAVILLYSSETFAQNGIEPKEPVPYQRLTPTEEIDEPVPPDEPSMDNYEIQEPEEPQEPTPYGFETADREPKEPTPFSSPDTSTVNGQDTPFKGDNGTQNQLTPAK